MTQPQPYRGLDRNRIQRDDLWRALFEASPIAIVVTDDRGCFVEANPAAIRLLDAPREALLGRSINELVSAESRPPDDGRGAIRADESQSVELALPRTGGEQRTVRFRAAADLSPGLHVWFLEDISDSRALQNERELRERFVASLSHDLRSPLTAAKMGAQLLARSADRPDRWQQQTSRVIRNIDRADQLIQNLVDVMRISAGERLVIERTEGDLAATAREVLEDQAAVHADRFVFDGPASMPALFDASALRRVLENLLGNGVKYGDPEGKVTVKLAADGDEVRVSVHNDGEPIAEADMAAIFQPFQRGSGRPQRGIGWSLGLILVRGIAEAHGGTIRAESTREAGTTFALALPKSATASPSTSP